ncbi:MAG: LysM peptidoglycan-binding domain-containing protein [Chloroflexota bacterium]|nr:LysM peptidoglycan-binding domain-containing protein [Chloroflexota bacterium]
MFEPTSRYALVEATRMDVPQPDGESRPVTYIRRRFIPSSEGLTTLLEHTVVQSDRLDTIAARYLGDPEQFWRVCDANHVLRPTELTDEPGRAIRIAMPGL